LPVKALTIFVIEYGFQIGLSVPVYHESSHWNYLFFYECDLKTPTMQETVSSFNIKFMKDQISTKLSLNNLGR